MSKRSGNSSPLKFAAFLALVVIAVITVVNWMLGFFGWDAGIFLQIVGWVIKIATLIGYCFIALYAYDWVAHRKQSMKILYWVCIVVLMVFLIWGWL